MKDIKQLTINQNIKQIKGAISFIEAFRYQNYLGTLIEYATQYLNCLDNVTIKKQEHLRTNSNPDAKDETVDVPKKSDIEFKPNQIIDFLLDVLTEKENLSLEIDKAKYTTEINIDSSVAINKQKQNVFNILTRIANIKPTEKVVRGSGYKFNAEGNQVGYNYDIKEITTIDFDRNKTKAIIKKLRNETDNVSNKLDKLQVELEVNYSPTYDLGDGFEDALNTFVSK